MAKRKTRAPAEDDVIALYAHLLIGAQERVKSEQRKLGALSKEAQQHGVSWPEVKGAMKEYDASPEQRRAKAERAARIYAALGAPVQLEMFDAYQPRANDTEAAAARKGRFAAICHGECSPPYPPGSPEGRAWMDGWHAVQALVAAYRQRFETEEAAPFQAPVEPSQETSESTAAE